jgi:hypothetical protein
VDGTLPHLEFAENWLVQQNSHQRRRGVVDMGRKGPVERRSRMPAAAARARAARFEQATKANATTQAVIAEIQRAGKTKLAAIAQDLEARGVRTPGRS